jgi:hypothetical protein
MLPVSMTALGSAVLLRPPRLRKPNFPLDSSRRSLAKRTGSELRKTGPRPARFAIEQLQRAMLAGAHIFGIKTLDQLDGWMELQMAHADKILARAAQAIADLREAPETQQLLLRVPRWLPLSGMLRAQLSSCTQPQQALVHNSPGHKRALPALRAAPPTAAARKSDAELAPPRTPPFGEALAPAFSRKALAIHNPAAIPPRVYSDDDLFHLQFTPEAKCYPRRAYTPAGHPRRTLDDETLQSLVYMEVAAGKDACTATARTASAASTNYHDSPPSDVLPVTTSQTTAFNPVPVMDVADLIHSVGMLFDTGANPA